MRKLLLSFYFMVAFAASMAGTIRGRIIDEQREPMVGAHVILKNTETYAIVGLDGTFVINNVSPGEYVLVTSFVGYFTQEKGLKVNLQTEQVWVDFQMVPDAKSLQEVVITSKALSGSEHDARLSEKTSNNVMNVVSAKAIELSTDVTVANVVQRISGVSIVRNSSGDPQFAIVRGMDRRYNYTLVNGVKIPSPDNKNRYIPLDIFPAALLDKLEVQKALTPSMEGDAVGGVINMVMKTAPEIRTIKGDLQLGYNQININQSFLQYDRSAVDYSTPYEKYGPKYQAQFSDFSKNNLVIKKIQPIPDAVGSMAVGDRFFNSKLGVLVGVGIQNTYRGTKSVWFQTSTDYFGTNAPSLDEMHERQYSTLQRRMAGHARIDYRFSEKNIVKLYVGQYRLANYQTRDEVVTQLDARGYDADNGNAILSLVTRTRTTDQKIFTSMLQGDHGISSRLSVNWSLVHASAKNNEPDIAQFERNTGLKDFQMQPVTIERHMPRTWQHNSDIDYTGYLNFVFTPMLFGNNAEFSTGGMYRKKDRDNFYNSYSFDPNPTTQTQGADWSTYADITQTVLNPLGGVNDPQNYKAHENLLDYYGQFKFYPLAKLQLLGGVRVENTDQGFDLKFPTSTDTLKAMRQRYTDVLPSIHAKCAFNDRVHLRASYFKSISRPGYFEIVPYYNSTQSDGYPEVGNPKLKHVQAHNFDLRWEYFPNSYDQFLIGTFYKRIINPIEYATIISGGNKLEVQPGNYGTATNWGLEVDYTRFFNQFGLKLNYTFTQSTITTTKALRRRQDPNDSSSPIIVETPNQTRPLQGQARHLGNISVLYKDQKRGVNAQLAMVYTGERIENVSPFLDNDAWVKPFVQLDLSAEKKLGEHFVVVIKGQNLLNSPYEVFIKKPYLSTGETYKYQTSNSTTLIRRDQYFQSYRIGLRFSF